MIVKFSKSYKNILKIKKDFYKNNKLNLDTVLKINKFYKKQKLRKNCKICKKKIQNFFIRNFGVDYSLCSRCNTNGKYEDQKNFLIGFILRKGKNYSEIT